MVKAIKFCYLVSVPLFLATLLYYYALLPGTVGVYFSDSGLATYSISRGMFFYACIAVFVLTNGVIFLYRRMAKAQVNLDLIDFAQMNKAESTYHWFNGFSLMLNVFYILSILFIGLYNSRENFNINNYATLVYIGPILIVSWMFWFIYLQITKK